MLNNEQIKMIAATIQKNGVPYYDVATELTDHLVEEMEATMLTTNDNFETVLQQKTHAWKTEWKTIVQAKKQQLRTYYLVQFKAAFFSYFTFPKIMFTACLVLATGIVLQKNNNQYFANAALHFLNIINFNYAFGKATIIRKNRVEKKQPILGLVCLHTISWYSLCIPIAYLCLTLINLLYDHHSPLPAVVYTVAVAVFPMAVLIALAWRKVNIAANESIRNKYRNAFYA
jgi:hypothetical protein